MALKLPPTGMVAALRRASHRFYNRWYNAERVMGTVTKRNSRQDPEGALRHASRHAGSLGTFSDNLDFNHVVMKTGGSLLEGTAGRKRAMRELTTRTPLPGVARPTLEEVPGSIPQRDKLFRVPEFIVKIVFGNADYRLLSRFVNLTAHADKDSEMQKTGALLTEKAFDRLRAAHGDDAAITAALQLMKRNNVRAQPDLHHYIANLALGVLENQNINDLDRRIALARDMARAIPADSEFNARAVRMVLLEAGRLATTNPLGATKLAVEMYDDAKRGSPEHLEAAGDFARFSVAASLVAPKRTQLYMRHLRKSHARGGELFDLAAAAGRMAATPARSPREAAHTLNVMYPSP